MTEVHRYKVVNMLSEAGNRISYDPHGPYVVMADAYDQLRTQNEALLKELESNKRMLLNACVAIGTIGVAMGADSDDDASELEGLATELRLNSERYVWLREHHWLCEKDVDSKIAAWNAPKGVQP